MCIFCEVLVLVVVISIWRDDTYHGQGMRVGTLTDDRASNFIAFDALLAKNVSIEFSGQFDRRGHTGIAYNLAKSNR